MSTATLPPPSSPMIDRTSMLSGLPADISSALSDASSSAPVDTPIDDTPEPSAMDDAPVEATPADETPVALDLPEEPPKEGVEPEPEPVAAAPEPTTVPADEPLDEGTIKVKDAKGKYQYRLDENRYKTVYGNHQLVQQATEILGEPLTADALKLRNDAYQAQERLFTNLTGGDPAEQREVLDFMLDEMKAAHEVGETGVDPVIPFTDQIYSTLREKAPDAYAHLRFQAGRDFIADMFQHAAQTNNQSLFSAAQHFAATLANVGPKPDNMTDAQYVEHIREITGRAGIPFYIPQEMQGISRGEDPVTAQAREIAELKAQLNGRAQTGTTEQYTNWSKGHVNDVNTAVYKEAVEPSLTSVADGWKNFPDDYKRLVLDPLNSEVAKAVRADPGLADQLKVLNARARRATSEGVRQQIGDQIKNLVVNRAKLAAEKAKGPILKFAADALKGRSAQTHDRRQAAQTRTAPQGQSTPVRHSAVPPVAAFKNGVFDANTAVKQAMAALGGR